MLANHQRFDRLSGRVMSRWILGTALAVFSSGCSICPSPYDYDYGTYGTKTPRTDMRHGRVGSLFSDPAYGANGHAPRVLHGAPDEILYGESIDGQDVIIDGVILDDVPYSESIPSAPGEIIIQ